MFMIHRRLLYDGLAIWAVATAGLRVAGQYLLPTPGAWATLALFAVSFAAMGALARALCRNLGVPANEWAAGAASLALPTLLLDPLSSAFFPVVFPNIAPESAGTFGGWMLCCCGGAFAGALLVHRDHAHAPQPAQR